MVVTPGGTTRIDAAKSPEATANAASHAPAIDLQRLGTPIRRNLATGPAPSELALSSSSSGTVRNAYHNIKTAIGNAFTSIASQGAKIVRS